MQEICTSEGAYCSKLKMLNEVTLIQTDLMFVQLNHIISATVSLLCRNSS